MMMKKASLLAAFAFLLVLAACSGRDSQAPLEGERISVLELQRHLEPDSDALSAQGFIAPAAWKNEFWPQAGGYPNHVMQHVALNDGALRQAWTANIGRGSTDLLPLTAQPIVADGYVFAMDARSTLTAVSVRDGRQVWQRSVRNPNQRDPVISGGIAFARGVLYVTTGYNDVLALNAADGKTIWHVRIPAPARAAPTVMDERLFITTLDNRLVALSVENGGFLWEESGITETAGLVGAASPAVSRDVVIPAFSSGEIFALRIENGAVAWTESLSSLARAGGLAGISDIRALPVIDKGLVIAISFGGRMIAVDERTGTRIWQRDIGGVETPWVVGNHVFVISNDNELVALGRDNGVIRWVTQLPRYQDPDRRRSPVFWTGPVMAGERLIIAGSDGNIMEIAPEDGDIIRRWSAGKSVKIAPVVAGETLYLLAEDGTLLAYR